MSHRVLCLLASGFEEIEAVTPIDLLRRAGANVVVASLEGLDAVVGRSSIAIRPDALLRDVQDLDFDLLLIPGGPGVKELRADGRAARLAKAFADAGKPVAAICAAPAVLHDAGLLQGRRFTAHFSVAEELGPSTGERVEEDGLLITARGAGTAVDFALAVVRRLYDPEKASEIAQSVMA